MADQNENPVWTLTGKTNVPASVEAILADGERVLGAYKTIRDALVLTDRRLVLYDVEGLMGASETIRTIPYRAIESFSIQNKGIGKEGLEILIRSQTISLKVDRSCDIDEMAKILAKSCV